MSGCTWDGLLKLQIPSQNGVNQPQLTNPIPHTKLTHEQRQLIHEDFIKATDLLGATYKAFDQLINVDPNNRLDHMTN